MSKVTQQVSEPKLKIHLSDSRAPSTHHIIVMSCVEAPMQTTRLLFDNKSNSAQQPISRCSEYTASPPESSGPHPTPLRGSQRPKLTGVCLWPPFLQDRTPGGPGARGSHGVWPTVSPQVLTAASWYKARAATLGLLTLTNLQG